MYKNALRLFIVTVFFQPLFARWRLNSHVTNANRNLKMQNWSWRSVSSGADEFAFCITR